MLDPVDIQFLNLYLRNQDSNWSELAKKSDLSVKRLRRIFEKLKSEGILSKDVIFYDDFLGTRIRSHISAEPNYPALGLVEYIVEVESTRQVSDELIDELHEIGYTSDFYKMISPNSHLVFFLRAPNFFIPYVKEYLKLLKVQKKLRHYSLNKVRVAIQSAPTFTSFPVDEEARLRNFKTSFENLIQDRIHIPESPKKEFIDLLHLKLLRELELNGRLKISMIYSHYNREYSTLTRRIKYIKSKLIRMYNSSLNNQYFNWLDIVIRGTMDERSLEILYRMVQEDCIGMKTTLYIHRDSFTWIISADTNDLTVLDKFLNSVTSQFSMSIVSEHSRPLTLNIENWDELHHEWKISNLDKTLEKLSTQVLGKLKKDLNNLTNSELSLEIFDLDTLFNDILDIAEGVSNEKMSAVFKAQYSGRSETWKKQIQGLLDMLDTEVSSTSYNYLKTVINEL